MYKYEQRELSAGLGNTLHAKALKYVKGEVSQKLFLYSTDPSRKMRDLISPSA